MIHHAYQLESHIVGFTLWVVGISSGIARLPDGGANLLAAIDEGEFDYGLDLLLDGLEERLAHERAARTT